MCGREDGSLGIGKQALVSIEDVVSAMPIGVMAPSTPWSRAVGVILGSGKWRSSE